jgi:hypothetical protein
MQPAPKRSAACALQQQRSRHALGVRDWLVLARFGDSSVQPAPHQSVTCAQHQQRSRHALDVRAWLVLARLGEFSMQPALQRSAACAIGIGRQPVRCNSSARATPSTCAIGSASSP